MEYEVVLADGSVVIAKADNEHEDLFRVLKGGSNNFGIVTSFVMKTKPVTPIWGGVALRPVDCLSGAAKALEKFSASAEGTPFENRPPSSP